MKELPIPHQCYYCCNATDRKNGFAFCSRVNKAIRLDKYTFCHGWELLQSVKEAINFDRREEEEEPPPEKDDFDRYPESVF